MVTCTDSSSRDVLTVPGACVAKRNILALRGSISAMKPRTPRPMAYSCRRACRAVPRPCPCHSEATMKAISARFVVEFKK